MNVLFDGEPAYMISANYVMDTAKAFLFCCGWVPKSVCKYNYETRTGVIKSWWYEKHFM